MRCGAGVQQRSGLPRISAKPAAQISLISEQENLISTFNLICMPVPTNRKIAEIYFEENFENAGENISARHWQMLNFVSTFTASVATFFDVKTSGW